MEVRFCPRCGASRLPGAMYCSGCGFAYGSIEPAAPERVVPVSQQPVAPVAPTAPPDPPVTPPAPPIAPPIPLPGATTGATPVAARIATPVASPPEAAASGARTVPGHLSATASLDRVRDRRRAVNGFVRGGAVLAAAGILLPLLGAPHPAAGLEPIGSSGAPVEVVDLVPLVVVAGLVTIALACAAAWTRDAIETGPALTVIGATGIGVIVLAVMSAGNLGYDAAGSVLPAVSLLVAGGAALLSAALVGVLIRE